MTYNMIIYVLHISPLSVYILISPERSEGLSMYNSQCYTMSRCPPA